ncbi:hypothetical protein J7E69_31280, partial [Rhodococcus enclensis]|nr:hypothetical protein [Rhodococcus qingshengii]
MVRMTAHVRRLAVPAVLAFTLVLAGCADSDQAPPSREISAPATAPMSAHSATPTIASSATSTVSATAPSGLVPTPDVFVGSWRGATDSRYIVTFNADGTTTEEHEGSGISSSGTWELIPVGTVPGIAETAAESDAP